MANESEEAQLATSPPTVPTDLNLLAKQAIRLEEMMRDEGIEEIKYKDGPHATHDSKKNVTVVAGDKTIIRKTAAITTITTINEGVDLKEAILELHDAGDTQKQIGSATNTSQQKTSEDLRKSRLNNREKQ